jgi:uncharacterized protein
LKETLEYFIRALVEDPDSVQVEEQHEGEKVLYMVTVAPDDIGKVIGKQGRTIKALRTIVRAGAARQGNRAEVEVAG